MKIGQTQEKVEGTEALTEKSIRAKQQEVGRRYQDAQTKLKQLIDQRAALNNQIGVVADQCKILEGSLRTYQDLLPRTPDPASGAEGVDVPSKDKKEPVKTEEATEDDKDSTDS